MGLDLTLYFHLIDTIHSLSGFYLLLCVLVIRYLTCLNTRKESHP